MPKALVITPVKDSLENTLKTIAAIKNSQADILHVIYNDNSTAETKAALEQYKNVYGYELVHIQDLTDHPSPNYRLVLQEAQKKALEMEIPMIIVESDVEVEPNTFSELLSFNENNPNTGLLAAITVDHDGEINFPYLRFRKVSPKKRVVETGKSLSFCCTLISLDFLKKYDFDQLDKTKHWYDTFLSDQAVRMGLKNILLMQVKVLHKPHGSRPWKQLKYTNPLKYYWLKLIKNRDKI